jgi:hypothetical protein
MNDYLEERVRKQQKWYEDKANENKTRFISYQTVIIVLGALIPVLVACESVYPPLIEYGGPLAAVISAIISILAGLDKLKQPQPNWFNYRSNEEALKKEEWFFKYKAGPYRTLGNKQAEILLVERIESIISADIARTLSSDEREDQEEGAGIPGQPPSGGDSQRPGDGDV